MSLKILFTLVYEMASSTYLYTGYVDWDRLGLLLIDCWCRMCDHFTSSKMGWKSANFRHRLVSKVGRFSHSFTTHEVVTFRSVSKVGRFSTQDGQCRHKKWSHTHTFDTNQCRMSMSEVSFRHHFDVALRVTNWCGSFRLEEADGR